MHLSVRTVRHLVRRFAQYGQKALAPDYDRCATKKAPADAAIFQKAMAMRQQHPRWGSGLIRVLLQEEGGDLCLSERTLYRWFRRSKHGPFLIGRTPNRACDDQRP